MSSPHRSCDRGTIHRIFNINVLGAILTTQAAVKHLGEGGSVINIGSSVSRITPASSTVYTGSKGALDALTGVWARELGRSPYGDCCIVDCLDAYLYYNDMARPKSDEKRSAILEAATRVIVKQGLSAPTAGIAEEAGVANGSLFTYFETKADLFNQLYLDLKREMASAAIKGIPERAELREQVFHMWRNWTNWAMSFPEKRRALAQLGVSEEIMPATRAAGHKTMERIAELLERSRANGPMRRASMGFVLAIMNSVAEATMDFMTQDRTNAKKHCKVGFDALWRMIA